MGRNLIGALAISTIVGAVYYVVTSDSAWTPTPPATLHAPPPAAEENELDEGLREWPKSAAQLSFRSKRLEGRAYSLDQSFEARAGDAAEVVAALLPLAEAGSEVAAFEIYLKISACQNELDRARDAAPNTSFDGLIPFDCRSIPADQWRSLTSRWLERAAEAGYVPAELTYAADPSSIVGNSSSMLRDPEAVSAYRRKAMNYLHRAGASGNVEALQKLAMSYANGILVDRDPVRAYAYNLAAERASRSIVPPDIAEILREKYATGLSASQIRVADQQGRKIYEDCCSP